MSPRDNNENRGRCNEDPSKSRKLVRRHSSAEIISSEIKRNSNRDVNYRGRMNKRVSFGSVSMREYDRIVGDNPGGRTAGPPLGIGWSFTETKDVSLHEHEICKQSRHKDDGEGGILTPLTDTERSSILKEEWCYADDEIAKATEEVERIQNEREDSNRALIRYRMVVSKVKKIGESCQQTFDRLIRRKQSDEFARVEYF